MKKIFVYAAVAALAMTAISCQKESLNENEKVNTSNDGLVFTASIDAGMDTRTTLTSEKKVNWEANDEITVNGVIYTAAPKSDATKADFTKKNSGDADPTGTFNAFYPTGIQDGNNAGGTLPATQTYAAGKITNVPMFATSTTTSLSFKNICGVLAVTIKSADFASVKSIKVSSSNCALSGAFTISDGQTATLTSEAQTAKAAVILNCGATAVTTASEGTVFYIAIPAQTYQNLKIELSSDGSSYTKAMTTKKDVDIAVAVNKVYPITFKEDAPDSIVIDCTNAANFRYDNGGVETAFPTTNHGKDFITGDFWLKGLKQYVFNGSVKNWGNTLNAYSGSMVKLPAIEGYVLAELEVTYSNASTERTYMVYDGDHQKLGSCKRKKATTDTTKITVASSSNADRYFASTGEMCARFILTYTKK